MADQNASEQTITRYDLRPVISYEAIETLRFDCPKCGQFIGGRSMDGDRVSGLHCGSCGTSFTDLRFAVTEQEWVEHSMMTVEQANAALDPYLCNMKNVNSEAMPLEVKVAITTLQSSCHAKDARIAELEAENAAGFKQLQEADEISDRAIEYANKLHAAIESKVRGHEAIADDAAEVVRGVERLMEGASEQELTEATHSWRREEKIYRSFAAELRALLEKGK